MQRHAVMNFPSCRKAINNYFQAVVFEEIATMDFPFEGIPTVPPRKDMDHMVRSHGASLV